MTTNDAEETALAAAAAADEAATATLKATEEAVAAAVEAASAIATSGLAVSAPVPTDRDILLGDETHKTCLLLQDIIRLHRLLWTFTSTNDNPTVKSDPEQVPALAQHLLTLLKGGKTLELAGLKDVPKPFMRSIGRFFDKSAEDGSTWKLLEDDETIHKRLVEIILQESAKDDLGNLTVTPLKDLKDWLIKRQANAGKQLSAEFMPEGKDAILLRCSDYAGEKMYEQQGGNKTLFHLASQLVTSFTNTSDKRVEAALSIMKGLDDIDSDPAYAISIADKQLTTTRHSRFLIRMQREDLSVKWEILDPATAAEFAVIFVFEVFLEKEIHNTNIVTGMIPALLATTLAEDDTTKPGTAPVGEPTDYDVLFGRGGMTNSHPGNRRFRDIIALHRPDYIRAIKMDKPGVARKIVKAIRLGNPAGRFLRKGDDGHWYDVGDRTAAEKTSQGLRERSNAEKRQRSALREALRIRKQDMQEDDDDDEGGSTKKSRADMAASIIPTLNYVGTNLPVPLSLSMKETIIPKSTVARRKAAPKEVGKSPVMEVLQTEGLPPNAVDEDGNILVTDFDILCGRGGLTNHHKGNKRFRDIVALHRPDYVRAPKIQKPSVARVIVKAIRTGDPPGRFLRKDDKTGKWVDIGDKKAAEKTSQALREKTNEEREMIKSNPSGTTASVLLPTPTTFLFPGVMPASIAAPVPVPVPTETVPEELIKTEDNMVPESEPEITAEEAAAEAAAVLKSEISEGL